MVKKLLALLLTVTTFGSVAQAQPSQPTVLYAGITNVLNGTDGQCLSIATGVLNAAACAGIATSVVINSTDVTGGVNGDVLTVGSGKVQQLALFSTANTWTASQTVQGATTTAPSWLAQLTGDTFARVAIGLNATDVARLSMGPGNAARDAFIERLGAGSFRLGTTDATSPVAQTVSVQNVVAGTSNTAGAALTINGSRGTGTGAGGAIHLAVASAGTTGTSQNALADALLISSDKSVTFSGAAKVAAIVENKGGACTALTISGGGITIDLSTGSQNYCFTSNANLTTITVSNCQGPITNFNLWITSDGNLHTNSTAWGTANIQWPNQVPPTLTQIVSRFDIVTVKSKDSCATWQAGINQNYGA